MPIEVETKTLNVKRYKTTEQVETAKNTIDLLQDYIELSKVEAKLKNTTNKSETRKLIDTTNETIFANVKEL